MDRLATAVEGIGEDVKPAAAFFGGASARLDALCQFLRKRGPWILASIPSVLVTIGALTPSAARGVNAVLAALGVHQ